MKFEEYCWHDSEIINIEINRSEPGKKDTIVFTINWQENKIGKIIFEDVYWASLNLNFGVIADECIDDAFIASINDEDLKRVYQKWNGLIDTIKLDCYVIKTISTDSEIKIIARTFKVI